MYRSITLALLFLHMGGTLTPLFLFPNDVFVHIPYAPTLEAQYILKNLVLISAGCVIGTSARRGGRACCLLHDGTPSKLPDLTRAVSGRRDVRKATNLV